MNVADSELVDAILVQAGLEKTAKIEDAEVVIFNTCSVRQHAEDRVLGRIANEQYRKRFKPELKIGIIGCMAQRIGERLVGENKGLDFAVGVDQYEFLPQLLQGGMASIFNNRNDSQLYTNYLPMHHESVCGFVTIMRGCNNFCSYCIVPYLRGRERSRPDDDIFEDIIKAGEKGIRDVTLLGQNVNSYFYKGLDFPGLLERLNGIETIERLRFITSHPKNLSKKLIKIMKNANKVCEHIHLPLQSGDDLILQRMNRGYSAKDYFKIVADLRANIPNIAITTDLIAGFPGETHQQFQKTLDMMKKVEFDYAFCFKYSEREGTNAEKLSDKVPEGERLNRLKRMIDLQREITLQKFQSQIGKTTEVLVESKSKHGGNQYSGKTRDYKTCVFESDEDCIGKIIRIQITSATSGTLIGEKK